MQNFPKISIITPTLNQAEYLENIIISVLSQDYPNLEYIVIDGGSTDGSVDIINKYRDRITYSVSEPDRGQAHAINKGLAVSTGKILAFINSDDYYLAGAFRRAAEEYVNGNFDVISGRCNIVNEKGKIMRVLQGGCHRLEDFMDFMYYAKHPITQPELFFSRSIFEKAGFFREDIYFAFDYEYWLRLAVNGASFSYPDQAFSCFRVHEKQKTFDNDVRINRDHVMIIQEYLNKYPWMISPDKKERIKTNISLLVWHTDFIELLSKKQIFAAFKKWLGYMLEGLPRSLISIFRWKKILRILRAFLK